MLLPRVRRLFDGELGRGIGFKAFVRNRPTASNREAIHTRFESLLRPVKCRQALF
jgi:hypothetical protein